MAIALMMSGMFAAPAAALTAQSIDFTLPASRYAANLVHMSATATSGLPVSFASDTTDICTVDGNVALLLSPGTCTVRASQPGDEAYESAPDITRSIDVLEPPPGPQPQAITFELPVAGYVGATIALDAFTNSPLEIAYTSLTPATCVTDGMLLALDAGGTCTVKASQGGNQEWEPAASVTMSMESRTAPFGTGGTSLGKYAFNGPITSVVLDDATGDTWVAGQFTQVGERTGSVARVNGPGSGSDTLDPASPDVIASQVYLMADDDSGYFVSGMIGSTNGDGVLRSPLIRLNADGSRDGGWAMKTGCSEEPEWAKGQPAFDLGPWIGAPAQALPTASGDGTVGLTLIRKDTGVATPTGKGADTCGGRMWSSIPPLPVLAACASWNICVGHATHAIFDAASHTLLTDVTVILRKGSSGETDLQSWLAAYDTSTGTRRWVVRMSSTRPPELPTNFQWLSYLDRLAIVDGVVLVSGHLRLDPVNVQIEDATSVATLDLATGAILQRWNRYGEQDLADPQGAPITGPTTCLPMAHELLVYRLASSQAGHAIGYGMPSGDTYPVCDYTVSGTGSAARLDATALGSLIASGHPSLMRQLPDVVVGGRYLTGNFDAFDLQTKQQVAGWHPSPSQDLASVVSLGSDVVVGGEFTFLHGAEAHYVARLSSDLAPVETFTSGLNVPYGGSSVWGMRRLGDDLLVHGSAIEGTEIAALDAGTGAVTWSAPATLSAITSVAIDAANDAFYAGGDDSPGHPGMRRFTRSGAGFAVDPSFAPALTGINGGQSAIFGLELIDGRLYVGGTFSKIGGVSRQGLARYTAAGSLDAWAPKLLTEMKPPAGAPVELRPRFFREISGRTVVGGAFAWYSDTSTIPQSPLLVYDTATGARVRPAVGSGNWFNAPWAEASDASVLGSSLYVALGDAGIAAFDTTTFDYQSYRSVRTFTGWGNNTIYALLTRPGTVALAGADGASPAAAALVDTSLVVGGQLPRWKTRTAGNVVEIGAGVLNADHTAPTVAGTKAAPRTGVTLGSGLPFWVTWIGADKGGAGVARYEVAQSRNGGAWTVLKVKATTPRFGVTLASGSTYRFRVRAVDKAGNVGAWSYSTTAKAGLSQQTSTRFSWSGTWRSRSGPGYSGGSARSATAAGARATYTFTGRAVGFVTTTGPTRGKARIYVDGALVKTVDLKATSTKYRYVAWYRSWSASSTHSIRVVVLGTAGRPRVDVDAFVTWK